MKKLLIKRMPYYKNKLKDKDYMTLDELYNLFDGEVVVTEKVDGSGKYEITPEGIPVYYEDVKYKHTILYNKLPALITINKYQVLLGYEFDGKICGYNNEVSPPILFKGIIIKDLIIPILDGFMNLQSQWSDDLVEGIVVANYEKQLFGKISRFDSSGEIDIHWSKKGMIKNYSTKEEGLR